MGGIALLVVVALSVGVFLAWRAADDLRTSVAAARGAAATGDLAGAQQSLQAAQDSAGRVLTFTTGPQWWLVERIPGAGAQVSTGREVATLVQEVSPSYLALLDLAVTAKDRGLTTAEGALDLDLISEAIPLAKEAATTSRTAAAQIEDLAGSEPELDGAADELNHLADLLDRAADAAQWIPGFLGADGPRTWAVLLQNTAEIRGSGGLLGAYALITVDQGKVTLDEAAARKDGLDSDLIPYEKVADEGELQTWGSDLSRWSDYNLSLDFPLTGELTAAGMAKRGSPVQGVVGLDAAVVAALVAGTGPIEQGGARLTQDNAEDFFTRDIYAKVPDVAAKDALTVQLLQATLSKALSGEVDIVALLRALVDPVSDGRLRVWSAQETEEAWLVTTPLGGALPQEPGPFVGVALNNSAGSKLDAYLDMAARYRVGQCPNEEDSLSTLEIRFRNDSPVDLPDYVDLRLDRPKAPKGSTSLLVHIYGPEGSKLRRAVLAGKAESFTSSEEGGHPVWGFDVELERGVEVILRLRFTEPQVANAQPVMLLPNLAIPPRGKVTERKCPAPSP